MRTVIAAAAIALVLAGCTTVPDSSDPEIVQPVAVVPNGGEPTGPPDGAEPRAIVDGFLSVNADSDPTHASASLFLNAQARTNWNDNTVTIVDATQVHNLVPGKTRPSGTRTGSITVTGQKIGTIDESGAYTPSLRGNGAGLGGVQLSATYGLVRKRQGQWRINSLPPGLLVTKEQFQQFRQFAVYFFDAGKRNLVPVPRYTQSQAAADLITWLVQDELAGQPPAQLQTGLPQTTTSKQVTVTVPENLGDPSAPVRIDIPGSGALDGPNRDRLAAQIAATLAQVFQVDHIELLDGGTLVKIPAAGGATFTAAELGDRFQPTPPGNQLYYVRDGGVYQESGRHIPGQVGVGAYDLDSAAVTIGDASDSLLVAGVRGTGDDAVLDIPKPNVPGALVTTVVKGQLSRPAWAPGRREVWIGDGSDLKRVTGVRAVQTVPLDVQPGKASGRVSAVRISPDGERIALVLTAKDSSQVYIGNIVRNGKRAGVTNLTPITPQSVQVADVAWNDQLKLFVVGSDQLTGEDQVYEVQCDGSIWNPRGTLGLPGDPDTVTAAAGSEAVVSIGETIWQQNGTQWQGLLDGETRGTNPVYLE